MLQETLCSITATLKKLNKDNPLVTLDIINSTIDYFSELKRLDVIDPDVFIDFLDISTELGFSILKSIESIHIIYPYFELFCARCQEYYGSFYSLLDIPFDDDCDYCDNNLRNSYIKVKFEIIKE